MALRTLSSPCVGLLIAALGAACRPALPAALQSSSPPLDAAGVVELYPSAPGSAFSLGTDNPNHTERLRIEKDVRAEPGTDGSIEYWSFRAYPLEYSSGGQGKTARLHIHASGSSQTHTWRNQQGYLSTPRDLKNQEFTAYVRVRGIFDPKRAAVSPKIRGGQHKREAPALASCTMMTFADRRGPGVARFGKELNHPDYDYVKLPARTLDALEDGRWVGLKLVSFAPPSTTDRVVNRLYVDADPFLADGRPRNGFVLFSEYVDRADLSTGEYTTLVSWGGFQTTLRVDGVHVLDVAILSVREIEASE